jgi:hypothetical protein
VTTKTTLNLLPIDRRKSVEVKLVGQGGEPGEDVAQIGERIVAVALARDYDRVNDGRSLARVGVAYKQPVFFYA